MNKFNDQHHGSAGKTAADSKEAENVQHTASKNNDSEKVRTAALKNTNAEQKVQNTASKDSDAKAKDQGADKMRVASPIIASSISVATKPNAFKGKWKSQVSAAKSNWGKLSSSELIKSEGDVQTLAELVQLRYAISMSDATKQVQRFMDRNHG